MIAASVGAVDPDETARLVGTLCSTVSAGYCYTTDVDQDDPDEPIEVPLSAGTPVILARVLIDSAGTRRGLCGLAGLDGWWTLMPFDQLTEVTS